jgi:hypothetical protein
LIRNELVDIESFPDGVTEAKKSTTDSVVIADARGAAPRPSSPQDEASLEFTRDLKRTVQRNEDPIENLPVIEMREELFEGQDPSPSIATFNESFGTSYRGELRSVGREMAAAGGGASKLMDETREDAPTRTLEDHVWFEDRWMVASWCDE